MSGTRHSKGTGSAWVAACGYHALTATTVTLQRTTKHMRACGELADVQVTHILTHTLSRSAGEAPSMSATHIASMRGCMMRRGSSLRAQTCAWRHLYCEHMVQIRCEHMVQTRCEHMVQTRCEHMVQTHTCITTSTHRRPRAAHACFTLTSHPAAACPCMLQLQCEQASNASDCPPGALNIQCAQ